MFSIKKCWVLDKSIKSGKIKEYTSVVFTVKTFNQNNQNKNKKQWYFFERATEMKGCEERDDERDRVRDKKREKEKQKE